MRIAVVGGKGTLGTHVCAELAGRGHDVRALSRSSEYRVDLTTGAGLSQALAGCDVIVDASNATRRAALVLVEGSRRLLAAAAESGVTHHVCVSIVGCDQVPIGYYKVKTAQEAVVERSAVPWSIVRATQFHELAAAALTAAGRYRIVPVPRLKLQTIAAAEVAQAVAGVAEGAPLHGRLQVAGPQTCTAAELARTWRASTGRKVLLVPVAVPGRMGRALRDGALTASKPDITGTESFSDWLTARREAGITG